MSHFKFPSIKEYYHFQRINDPTLYVFEKVDGANVSLRKERGNIVPWSRGGAIKGRDRYYFQQFMAYVYEGLSPGIFDLPDNLIPFGEFTHSEFGHILYDNEHLGKLFLIGIYDSDASLFLSPEKAWEWVELMGLEEKIGRTPLVREGSIDRNTARKLLRESKLYTGPPEGLVLHQYDQKYPNGVRMTKVYHSQFQEIDPSKEGVERYLTLKRFIKAGQKSLANTGSVSFDSIVSETVSDVLFESGREEDERSIRRIILPKYEDVVRGVLKHF